MFYDRLLRESPESAALFVNTDMAAQRRKFVEMLEAVVHLLERPEELTDAALALGHRHAKYGVGDRHYPDVGATLLSTLDDILGEHSSAKILDAWRDAYSLLASIMQRGARQG